METITHLTVERIQQLGFSEKEQGLYTNGKFNLKYSGYGIAVLYKDGDDQPLVGIIHLAELEFAVENYDALVC